MSCLQNSPNWRKKERKSRKGSGVMKTEKSDFEGLLMKYNDIIDVPWKHAKDHMDPKDH
jgi:hypothetical protein